MIVKKQVIFFITNAKINFGKNIKNFLIKKNLFSRIIINQNFCLMKKILFSLTLILSIFSSVHAGYVIRGINAWALPQNLKNYTLTIDNNGPVSAASMYSTWGNGSGRNSIVILYPIFYNT